MKVKNYISKNKKLVFMIIFYTFISVVFISLIPIFTKLIIDYYGVLNFNKLLFFATGYILSIIFFLFFEYRKKLSIAKFNKKYNLDMKSEIFNSILDMNQDKLYTKTSGDIVNSIVNDTSIIYQNYIYCYIQLYISIISFLVYITYMLYLHYLLTIVIIISSILSFFIPKLVGKEMKEKRKKVSDHNGILIENLRNLLEAKEIFNDKTKKEFSNIFYISNYSYENEEYDLSKYIAFTSIFSGASLYFINIIVFISGILLISFGKLKLSSFIAIIGFVDLVALPIRDIIFLIITIKSSDKIIEKLDFYFERNKINKKNLEDFNKIKINNLNFSINNFSLNNINMQFNKGYKYALIGENGSGKSVLMKILAGKYKCKKDEIYIDDVDINELNTNNTILYLSNLFLLNCNVIDNVKLSNPYKEIDKVSFKIIEDIIDKPIKTLSMGEKAKVNLARAINSDYPVLILDEFLANIDKENEVYLTKLLIKLKKTIIIITHNKNKDYLDLFDKVYKL